MCSSDLLDPQARHLLWERLYRLKSDGVTLIITTHYMDEAEQLCNRLVVMDKGLIVAEGSPRQLIEQHSTREVLELRFGIESHERWHDPLAPFAERVEVLPDRVLLYVHDGDEPLANHVVYASYSMAVDSPPLAPESLLTDADGRVNLTLPVGAIGVTFATESPLDPCGPEPGVVTAVVDRPNVGDPMPVTGRGEVSFLIGLVAVALGVGVLLGRSHRGRVVAPVSR